MTIKNLKIDYHRNGVSGNGFHVATFNWKDDGEKKQRHMVAIIFEGQGDCAVLDIDETAKDNIEFANGNSWRGDHFEDELRKAIEQHNKELHEKIMNGETKNAT